MDNTFGLILLMTFLIIGSSSEEFTHPSGEKKSLQLVAIVHRHGLRAPETTFPSDQYKDQKTYWPDGYSQLTLEGKRQLYQLGKGLQKWYKNFIAKYSINALAVRSSDYDRCLMSTELMLAAWFPPTGNQVWNKHLKWQPIPVHSVPILEDHVISLEAPCKKYDQLVSRYKKEIIANLTNEEKELAAYMSKYMEEDISQNPTKMIKYYTTVLIEAQMGYPLPSWAKDIFPEKMQALARTVYRAWAYTDYMKRHRAGGLLKDIMQQFKKKTEGSNKNKKVLVYSGHDVNVIGIWHALGLDYEEIFLPPFGSALMIELHKYKSKRNFYVQAYYVNTSQIAEPYRFSIPGCPEPCSFAQLYKVTEYMRTVNFTKDCALD